MAKNKDEQRTKIIDELYKMATRPSVEPLDERLAKIDGLDEYMANADADDLVVWAVTEMRRTNKQISERIDADVLDAVEHQNQTGFFANLELDHNPISRRPFMSDPFGGLTFHLPSSYNPLLHIPDLVGFGLSPYILGGTEEPETEEPTAQQMADDVSDESLLAFMLSDDVRNRMLAHEFATKFRAWDASEWAMLLLPHFTIFLPLGYRDTVLQLKLKMAGRVVCYSASYCPNFYGGARFVFSCALCRENGSTIQLANGEYVHVLGDSKKPPKTADAQSVLAFIVKDFGRFLAEHYDFNSGEFITW